ncbi:MAG: DNA-3-methyladenine glycosylase I [Pseudomonadota bacterium]
MDDLPDPTGRCPWCGTDPLYVAYHDAEWGVPERDPRALWETLMLEAFQAGLSWITILRKRETFRARFEGFAPDKIARWGEAEATAALADPGIIRHRGKIEATVAGARIWLQMQEQGGFDRFLWAFVDGTPIQNRWETMAEVPAETPLSREISKALKAKGFKFVGPTIVYAFLQAAGLVNDHLVGCPRHAAVARMG